MTSYERVKLSRERTAATFPLPNVVDCIRYAICELAEYDDAWLRIERAGDRRNNERQPDPRAELGQAFYMLLSAAVQLGVQPTIISSCDGFDSYPEAYSYAVRAVGFLLSTVASPRVDSSKLQSAFDSAYSGLYISGAICTLVNIGAMVDDACAAFETKHAAVRP